MSDVNKVVIEGRLTKAAELSYFQDRTPYCQFSIGNNETYKDQYGNYQSIGSFFDCAIKGPYAESMAKHLSKGRSLTVVGRLKQSRWEKDGQKYSRVIIKVEEVHLRPTGNNTEQQPNQQITQQQYQPAQEAEEESTYIPFGEGEDIPF